MSPTVFVTIAAKTELPYARLLHASVARHHPEAEFVLLLLDEPEGVFDPAAEPFTIWRLADRASWPRWRICAFVCELDALRQAATPVFLDELVAAGRWEKIIYLDVRSLLFAPVHKLLSALDTHRILVTPRLTQIPFRPPRPNHIDWANTGAASTALIALTGYVGNRYALRQWRNSSFVLHHLEHPAHFAPLNVDRVVYLWPRSSAVFYEPGYGVSYWNLHESDHDPHLEKQLALFHFLGFDPEDMEHVKIGTDRIPLPHHPALLSLLERYRQQLKGAGMEQARTWSYSWSQFDNGARVPPLGRELYRESAAMAQRWERPFTVHPKDSLFAHFKESVGPSGAPREGGIPRIWWEVWRRSGELQGRFPDPFAQSRPEFVDWIASGVPLGGVHPADYDPQLAPTELPLSTTALQQDRVVGLRGSLLRRTNQLIRKTGGKVLRLVLSGNRALLDKLYFSYIERTTQAQAGRSIAAFVPSRPSYEAPRAADSPLEAFGMNIGGYLTGEFGLAEAGRSIVRAIQTVGIPYVLRNYILDSHRWGDQTLTEFTDNAIYPVNLLMFNGPEMPMMYSELGASWYRGKYNIGLWYWETQKIPDDWLPSLKILDEVWATSEFVAGVIEKSTGAKVSRIINPIQINESLVKPNRAKFELPEDPFLFLFSFDFHSYTERKNPMAVIEAYKRGLGSRKDACLVIKCLNSATFPEKTQALRDSLVGINAHFVDCYLERYDMFSLIASCDCYVSLHRTEGLGLGMAEAMYLGKPVIATGYSGNMDFMNEENSFPIRYSFFETTQAYGLYPKGTLWVEADIDHAAEVMQKLADDRPLAARVGALAREHIHTNFSPEAAGRRIEERLREILKERG